MTRGQGINSPGPLSRSKGPTVLVRTKAERRIVRGVGIALAILGVSYLGHLAVILAAAAAGYYLSR